MVGSNSIRGMEVCLSVLCCLVQAEEPHDHWVLPHVEKDLKIWQINSTEEASLIMGDKA
jgi:hypothetical protein